MSVRKPNARFLPTLTEVVVPVAPTAHPVVSHEWMVERVLQTVMPAMDQRINAAMQELVQQQLAAVMPDLLLQMEALVRSAVEEAVAASTGSESTGAD